MNCNTTSPIGNLIPSAWALSALRTVRDALQSLEADRLIDARDVLACTLSEAIGGLSTAPAQTATTIIRGNTRVDDGPDDFEDLAAADREQAMLRELVDLPSISGGAPEFEPSPQDLADYHAWCESVDFRDREAWMDQCDGDGPLSESDVRIATGSF